MRESQKMRLDIKLHTKIIDSIILIQRWFRGILLKRKFLMYRSAAITIQSYWRMYLAQKRLGLKKMQINAATMIQAAWRGYKERKWMKKLKHGIVIVQARVRGYIAREAFKIMKLVRNI